MPMLSTKMISKTKHDSMKGKSQFLAWGELYLFKKRTECAIILSSVIIIYLWPTETENLAL